MSDTLIYAIAGRGSAGAGTSVEVYNPAIDSWSAAPALPTGRSGCDAAVVNGKIFVLGGEVPGVFDDNEMYDPQNQTWHKLDSMPNARHGIGAVSLGDTVYAIAGATSPGYGACKINEVFLTANIASVTESELNDETISVFPNPVSNELNINSGRHNTGKNLFIFDVYGKILFEKPVIKASFKIETSGLNREVYFLKIGNTVKKIVKL